MASTMFSMGRAKTLPAASQASAVGGSLGRTIMMGPEMSVTASAETQLSSSLSSAPSSSGFAALSCRSGLSSGPAPAPSAASVRFLFLGFLSPLNVSGFTMLVCGERWCNGVLQDAMRKWYLMHVDLSIRAAFEVLGAWSTVVIHLPGTASAPSELWNAWCIASKCPTTSHALEGQHRDHKTDSPTNLLFLVRMI